MTTLFDWSQVEPSRRSLVEEAEEAAKRVSSGRDFFDGFAIGHGVLVVQEQAMTVARTDDPAAYAYRQAWRAVAAEYPHIAGLDKTERYYYAWMADNEAVLREWRAGLNLKQKRAWNHPRTVFNHAPCGKAAKDAQKAASEPKGRSRGNGAAEIGDATARLQQVLDKAEQRIGPALAEMFDLSPEHIEASADNFVDIFGEEAARRFFAVLQRRFAPKPDPEQPVDPAFAQSLASPRRQRKGKKHTPQSKEPASI